jgi:DNA-binding transcriptional MocR family regulator
LPPESRSHDPNPTHSAPTLLAAASDRTLVEQIVAWYAARIGEGLIAPGARLPSIRRFAERQRVSRFTVVAAYDRLVARGLVESRRGSGFYVRRPPPAAARREAPDRHPARPDFDVAWLLRNLFRQMPADDMPGGGVLPAEWLDDSIVADGLRAVGRPHARSLLGYGEPQGYAPLREHLAARLAEQDVHATVEQIVTTNGATQGIDLIAQHLVRPGDTVFVDEPTWFLLFGRFAAIGARLVGIPRRVDGPDMDRFRALLEVSSPRLFVTSSVLHNPTGTSISAPKAFELLQLAERHDFRIVDDDVYGDLYGGAPAQRGLRLGALDQLRRVIHLGGFSKTLAASLRVGFVACDAALAAELTDRKILAGLTSPELGERIVHRVLSEGRYRRHVQRLRERLARARAATAHRLEALGLDCGAVSTGGMFLWADAGLDTASIAREMFEHGFLMAPGTLFVPDQRPSTYLRFNVATSDNQRMLERLDAVLRSARARRAPPPDERPDGS